MRVETREELQELLHHYEVKTKQIKKTVGDIVWHTQGMISREEAWALTYEEQTDLIKRINEQKENDRKNNR